MAHDADIRRMCNLTLAALPSAVGCSRLFVRQTLKRWDLAYLGETAELVTSELVTNAVKATGTMDMASPWVFDGEINMVQVRLILVTRSVFICVWDRDTSRPVTKEPDLDDENGRGMFLIEAMSERWGVHHPRTGGKFVWSELDCSPPTTMSGLPSRGPWEIPTQCLEMVYDPRVVRRFLEDLKGRNRDE